MSRFGHAFLLALLLVCATATVEATTMRRVTIAEMSQQSTYVVLADVMDQHTFRDAEGQVFTDTTIRVQRELRGEVVPASLTIRQWGGTLDGRTRHVSGDARFTIGETAVLFLRDPEPDSGVVYLTALAQSKFDVVAQEVSGTLLLAQDLRELSFYEPNTREVVPARRLPSAVTLEQLTADAIRGGRR